ncbi:unnamed protein product [Caenorhabditis auriculariae]|uniref:Uncharacterized protein n=1 Tax=Caenorhabditis auriculariae TaxID=2777116 RepID=A0A8S1H2Z3_9PELO|nr:unnamed protein product [Caenorhabditis auriculariae]
MHIKFCLVFLLSIVVTTSARALDATERKFSFCIQCAGLNDECDIFGPFCQSGLQCELIGDQKRKCLRSH